MEYPNQIIELRQKGQNTLQYIDDQTGNVRNGDFKVRLRQPVILNQGDTLRLNQVFLETEEVDTDIIVIPETLTLRLDYIRYLKDIDNIQTPQRDKYTITGTGATINDIAVASVPLDKTPSFLCSQNSLNGYGMTTKNGGANFAVFQRKGEIYTEAINIKESEVSGITDQKKIFKSITFSKINPSIPTERFSAIFQLKSLRGEFYQIVVNVPPMNNNLARVAVNIDLITRSDASFGEFDTPFKFINAELARSKNIGILAGSAILENLSFGAVSGVLVPEIIQKTAELKEGKYHADELGEIITNLFTDSNLTNAQPITDSSNLLRQPSLMVNVDQTITTQLNTDNSNIPFTNTFGTHSGLRVFVNPSGTRFNLYGAVGAKQVGSGGAGGQNIPIPFVKNNPPIFAGSDSFACEYDNELNKFKFSRIHTSIRDKDAGNNPSIQLLDNPTITTGSQAPFPPNLFDTTPTPNNNSVSYVNAPQNTFICNSYGGIIMTSLSATIKSTTTFFDFWEDKLGFDLSVITAKPVQNGSVIAVKNGNTDSPAVGNFVPQFASIAENLVSYTYGGVNPSDNITEDISSIDGLHNVSTTTGTATTRGHKYYNLIDVVNFDTANKQRLEAFINTTLTSQIFASSQLQTDNIDFAYYLIDINASIQNNYLTEREVKKNIFSAINRYYIQGGYLSGTNSGIEYTHVGDPMLISDFDIRILKPDGTIADNLKQDNTIFLEVIRGQ